MNTTHPNALVLQKIYSDFARGDFDSLLKNCADSITFQIPGKSKVAGKYTKADFVSKLMTQFKELSGGTLKVDAHDIMASDRHAIALVTETLTRAGKPIEFRTVHVWRFEGGGGKPVAWYEYPRDLYQYDATWS